MSCSPRLLPVVSLLGCRTELRTTPVSRDEVRAMTEHLDVDGDNALQVHAADHGPVTRANLMVRDLGTRCGPAHTTTMRSLGALDGYAMVHYD